MQKFLKKIGAFGLIFFSLLVISGSTLLLSAKDVQAATGFVTKKSKTYYYDANGKKHKGWLTLNGKKYYFSSKGVMKKGWMTNSKKQKYYFDLTTGVMQTGWKTWANGKKSYFNPSTGVMKTGWGSDTKGNKRYFSSSTGYMATGWMKNASGQLRYFKKSNGIMLKGLKTVSKKKYRFNSSTGIMMTGWYTKSAKKKQYFNPTNGVMAAGWTTIDGKKYYFNPSNGVMVTGMYTVDGKGYYLNTSTGEMITGWVTYNNEKYYFMPSTGVMATGSVKIDNVTYIFSSTGILEGTASDVSITQPNSGKTIKNYLAGAFQPLGQALYVWGGGWYDSTRKGVSPEWKKWYDKQDSSYNYRNYNDLSKTNRAKGLDCSGFVGWAAYQVMQTKSDVGGGYTVVSGSVGSSYKERGWGTIMTQSALSKSNYKMYPGDIGYNDGHTWIVVGQCSDKSVVIIHSTPQAGVQLSGTTTPSGDYDSQAVALAKKYMQKFAGYKKYEYHPSCGNYIRNGSYLRWNTSTLADPDGYRNKTADQILADLFK